MYIEPCCVDRQLPSLLRQNKGNGVFFQTSGDVTVTRFMQAVSCMVEPKFAMLLAIPEIDRPTLQTIRYYFTRDWQGALLLLTQKDQTELVRDVMSDVIDNVQYAFHDSVADGMVAFLGKDIAKSFPSLSFQREHVIIQGAMLLEKDPALTLYSAAYGSSDGVMNNSQWSQATAPAISRLRINPAIEATGDIAISALKWK